MMSLVWELDLGRDLKIVLLAFADHADDEGWCYPSIGRVAHKTGYSMRSVRRKVSELRDLGVLEPVAHDDGGRGQATEYRLLPEEGTQLKPYDPEGRRLTDVQRERYRSQLLEKFGPVCQHCGEEGSLEEGPDGEQWHIDRVVPGSEGGRYIPSNITLSCGSCNRSKNPAKMAAFSKRVPTLSGKGCHSSGTPTIKEPSVRTEDSLTDVRSSSGPAGADPDVENHTDGDRAPLPELLEAVEEWGSAGPAWAQLLAPLIRAVAFTDADPPPSPDDEPWTVRRELSRCGQLIESGSAWTATRIGKLYIFGRFYVECGELPGVEPGEPFGINRLIHRSASHPRSLYAAIEDYWYAAAGELEDEGAA